MNANSMTKCGKCGSPLSETNRVEIKEEIVPELDKYGEALPPRCPCCRKPMEEGTLEVSGRWFPRWVSAEGSATLTTETAIEGFRCRDCSCLLLRY